MGYGFTSIILSFRKSLPFLFSPFLNYFDFLLPNVTHGDCDGESNNKSLLTMLEIMSWRQKFALCSPLYLSAMSGQKK